ncbi:MAG: hypothetical protein ACMXYL_01885 [Candidatus Woesearchaeota archaeon]
MANGSLYYRLASNGFIDSYLNNNTIDGIIEECANKEFMKILSSRDTDMGKNMLRSGLGQGIRSYLLDILDTYMGTDDQRVLNHNANTDAFSQRIYSMIVSEDLIEMPSAEVTDDIIQESLIMLSEYSEAMAESFMAYVHNNIVSPKIKRIY